MNTRANRWLVAAALLLGVACNPYPSPNKSAPQLLRVLAYDSDNRDGQDPAYIVEAPNGSGTYLIANANQGSFGATAVGAARPGKRVGLAVEVQFSAPLNGDSVQASATDCTPRSGAFTFPAAPIGEAWYACYNPGNPDVTVGGSIIFFKSQTSPASRKNDPRVAVYEPATNYRVTGTVRDQVGNPIPIDFTLDVSAERIDAPVLTPGTGTVDVSWGAAAGGSGYDVERAANIVDPIEGDLPGTFVKISGATPITATSFLDTGRTAGTVYWYRVTTHGTNGTVVTGSPSSTIPLASAPSFTNLTATGLTAEWTSDTGTTFDLQRALDVGGFPGTFSTVSAGVAGTSVAVTGLTLGTTYWFRVQANGPYGPATPGAAASTDPLTVDLTGSIFCGPGACDLDWTGTGPFNAVTLDVQRAPDVGGAPGTWATLAAGANLPGTTETFTDTTVVAGSAYWYRVNAKGFGPTAVGVADVTPAPSVGTPTINAAPVVAGSVKLTWTAAEALTYDVQRAPDVAGVAGTYATLAAGTGLTATTFNDATAVLGTKYWYRIVARGYGPAVTGAATNTAPVAAAAPTFTVVPGQVGVAFLAAGTKAASFTLLIADDVGGAPGGYFSAGSTPNTSAGGWIFTFSGTGALHPGSRYWFKVVSEGYGVAAVSPEASVLAQ